MINKLKNFVEDKYIGLLIFLILFKYLNILNDSFILLKISKRLKIKINRFKKDEKLKNKDLKFNKDFKFNKEFDIFKELGKSNDLNIINNCDNKKELKCKNDFNDSKKSKNFKEFKEKKGQLSLEFLLISLIVILAFISISLPLAEIAIGSTLDLSESLETKSEILKITGAIDDVYSDGIGSKRVVIVEVPKDIVISFSKDFLSNSGIATTYIDLNKSTNNTKKIEVPFKANNSENTLILNKRVLTKVIVQWTEEGIVVKK